MQNFKNNIISKVKKLPLGLLGIICLICIIGFIVLWSAAGGSMVPWAQKQIINFFIFLPIAILIAIIDIRIIFKFSYVFYILILLLLIGVEFFGTSAMGAKRWIDLGFTRLQPSEPAKLALVLMLAKYFHQLKAKEIGSIYHIIWGTFAAIIPILLIIKQPDLGTGIITLFVVGSIFFAAGVKWWKFVTVGISITLSLPIIWNLMHEYQRKRIEVFLNPEKDPLDAGYNIIQSKIAIGSGGLFGKGLTSGTQSHLDFLPEHQTDFIFATMAEETGFIGGITLLFLYMLILLMSLSIAVNCRSMFSKLTVVGISTIFFTHIFVNMAMVMGFVPAVGIPLPFISYGGTMIASMLIGFGIIMNAHINQHYNLS